MSAASRVAVSRHPYGTFFLPLLSGLLLGVSFPTWPSLHLEPLAWFALLPLLLSLEHEERFGSFFRKSWAAMLLFSLITLWWVCLATFVGGVLTVLLQSLFSTVPLMVFYHFKKRSGVRFALLALPFVWTGWEWAYMQQDFSLGWLTFGNSQANLLWMVQYADLTGVWGVSFWLVLFNVLALLLVRGKESFSARAGIAALMIVMIAAPLLYARQVFRNADQARLYPRIRVTLAQPNIDPHEKWGGVGPQETLSLLFGLTGRAVSEEHPDLVIWPETAIPFFIRLPEYKPYMDAVWNKVSRWNTNLLTGVAHQEPIVHKSASGEALAAARVSFADYNASMLLRPSGGEVQMYRKMRLVPFGERVPYLEYLPWLEKLSFSMSGISSWQKGREATVMHFTSRNGQPVRMANIICYESIFPGLVTQFVRGGAQFLTLVTNDGWYGTSYGPWQHAAIGRLRCIENRRAMARCANTGVTLFYDSCGRNYAETAWWQPAVLTASVPLEKDMTYYTMHPDLVPLACLGVTGVLAVAALARRRG
jgi:apolipoprotein N-acyltransferase